MEDPTNLQKEVSCSSIGFGLEMSFVLYLDSQTFLFLKHNYLIKQTSQTRENTINLFIVLKEIEYQRMSPPKQKAVYTQMNLKQAYNSMTMN